MADHPDINKWVRECSKNNRSYQEKLYRHYFDSLLKDAKRYTSDKSEQLTMINDAFLTAYKKIDQYTLKGSFEGWLRKIMYFKMIDLKRKNKGRFNLELDHRFSSVKPETLSALYYEDIENSIRILPEATKRVFIKYAIEGYKHKEIASDLGISVGTSKWHVAKAREMLQTILRSQNNIAQ